MKFHGLILAAGASSRLGQPKQLVHYQGPTLIEHAINSIQPWVDELFVVLGHQHQQIKPLLASVHVIHNSQWAEGMGSSLRAGVAKASHDADGLLVALCDQPKISSSHYQRILHEASKPQRPLVCTGFANTQGVPAVFQSRHFAELAAITGDQGARQLLAQKPQELVVIPCEAAACDVDTKADLRAL